MNKSHAIGRNDVPKPAAGLPIRCAVYTRVGTKQTWKHHASFDDFDSARAEADRLCEDRQFRTPAFDAAVYPILSGNAPYTLPANTHFPY